MDIKIGKYYVNKTWRFLLPCLRGHGDIFVRKFNPLFKLAVGVHDTLLDGSEISDSRNIYIMIDKMVQQKCFFEFLDWIKYQDYYVADYCPDADIKKSRKHIIVITVPKGFETAYDNFLQGKYSQMYTEDQVNLLFSNPDRKKEYDILSKNKSALDGFIKTINTEFDVNANPKDFQNSEYELPLRKSEEIFNCCSNYHSVYFGGEIVKIWS